LKKTVRANLRKTPAKRAVLFGSIASGSEKTDSGIDLFIQVKDARAREKLKQITDKLFYSVFGKIRKRFIALYFDRQRN
jgi:predicted nucleotidyltransferase